MQALITAKPDIAPAEAAEKAVAYAEELLRKPHDQEKQKWS